MYRPHHIKLGIELEFYRRPDMSGYWPLYDIGDELNRSYPWRDEITESRHWVKDGPIFQLGLDTGMVNFWELRMGPVRWNKLYDFMPDLHKRLVWLHQAGFLARNPKADEAEYHKTGAMHIHVSPRPESEFTVYNPFYLDLDKGWIFDKSVRLSMYYKTVEFRGMMTTFNWYTVYLRMQLAAQTVFDHLNRRSNDVQESTAVR